MKRIGEKVGHIRLVEHLGTGGMGDVFAGHDENLDRSVAVKAIRPEFLSADVRQRLVREARLLSSLDHENICRIYELLEEDGEVFLVLELIRGRDLREVLESNPPWRVKLELAEKITVALEAAHREEIIHRDLKLENVMVRDDGIVKVLDFGVARSQGEPLAPASPPPEPAPKRQPPVAHGGRTTRDSSLTVLGEAVGTVTTMSPEQARGEGVATSTDLFSLGLLLQELFTGRSPYPEGLSDDLLWLRAKDSETLPVEGIDRELAALINELKSARPADRPTASQTLARLRRIRERPRRYLRRALAALALLLIAAGAVKYTLDLRRERNLAIEAQLEAERRGRESEEVVKFLVGLFESADPNRALGEDPRASEILERGAERVDTELVDQPLVRARLMETIGQVSRLLGRGDQAEEHLTEAVAIRLRHQGEDHPELALTRSDLGDLMRLLGRFEEAERELERSFEVLESVNPRASTAVLNRLGALALETGEFEHAATLFRQVAEVRESVVGDADEMVVAARNNLAIAYVQSGRLEEAAAEHAEVLAIRRRTLGDNHPQIGVSLNNLAVVRYQQQDLEAAATLMAEALAIWQRVYGDAHPEVATATSNLGELALARGDLVVAESRFRGALEAWQAALGDEHPDLAYAWHGLGHVARQKGDFAKAAEHYREALRLRQGALADHHPELQQTRQDLGEAEALVAQGAPSQPSAD